MEIKIGGKKRPVAYTVNALIEFEELTGIDLMSGNKEALSKLKNIRALAFVGLKHGAKDQNVNVDFTEEEVGNWISFNDGSISNIMTAWQRDIGKGDGVENKEEAPNLLGQD